MIEAVTRQFRCFLFHTNYWRLRHIQLSNDPGVEACIEPMLQQLFAPSTQKEYVYDD
jgi:hypothetical protein